MTKLNDGWFGVQVDILRPISNLFSERFKVTVHHNDSLTNKVPTESLEYFVNHIFLDVFGNEVYCVVYHCKEHSFCFTMIPYL